MFPLLQFNHPRRSFIHLGEPDKANRLRGVQCGMHAEQRNWMMRRKRKNCSNSWRADKTLSYRCSWISLWDVVTFGPLLLLLLLLLLHCLLSIKNLIKALLALFLAAHNSIECGGNKIPIFIASPQKAILRVHQKSWSMIGFIEWMAASFVGGHKDETKWIV